MKTILIDIERNYKTERHAILKLPNKKIFSYLKGLQQNCNNCNSFFIDAIQFIQENHNFYIYLGSNIKQKISYKKVKDMLSLHNNELHVYIDVKK